MKYSISRRDLLRAAGYLPLVSPLGAAEAQKREDKSALPVIPKRVEKVFMAPGQHPNDLDAVTDGLWILDQTDPNKAHKVRWEDGKVLVEVQTESMHGSGIAYRNGALWISSTATGPCPTCLKTLKVDAKTGKTLSMYESPGAIESRMGRPGG